MPLENVISHAENEVAILGLEKPLSYNSLGCIVRDLWGGQVQKVKRGPRLKRRACFLNVAQKVNRERATNRQEIFTEMASDKSQALPEGWRKIVDSERKVSFTRSEKWEFNNQRICTELTVEMLLNDVHFVIKSHGCEVKVSELKIGKVIAGLPLGEQVISILKFLDSCTICTGIKLDNEQSIMPLVPHQTGILQSTIEIAAAQKVAFSQNCNLIALSGTTCGACSDLKYNYERRQRRQTQRGNGISKYCNKRFLSKEEVGLQLTEERKLHHNSKKREAYWREKFDECLEMAEEDHQDLTTIFKDAPHSSIPSDMKTLWDQQNHLLSTTKKNGYRWHPKIIRLCLELYCKNPHVLDPLRRYLILPSNKTIRLYKNRVQNEPGWNDEILEWCRQEAKAQNLRTEDYWGGLVLDEMKIQENLEMVYRNGKHKLVGFVNLGPVHDLMLQISGTTTQQLATHVLQFVYLSDRGFRFPVAQFPSGGCTPSSLYLCFWQGVMKLREYGFVIYWCMLDGAEVNRQFIKMHFNDKDPAEKKFVAQNIYTGLPMIFIMDPKHNLKKIRNNINKSNLSVKPRCLKKGGKTITWLQLKAAYDWDQNSFSLPVHEKLTPHHFQLDPSSKMRNHLAEDVLNGKMLYLMQKYQEHLQEGGEDATSLNATIELLSYTSDIVSLFSDKLAISSPSDARLNQLNNFHNYLLTWREETQSSNQEFISSKLFFDLQSMCLGFQALVSFKLNKFPSSVIKPNIVNQDCVENHFCQVRACHGQNNNPTYAQQQSAQNSIRLGQTTISKKSNAGVSTELSSCSIPNIHLT